MVSIPVIKQFTFDYLGNLEACLLLTVLPLHLSFLQLHIRYHLENIASRQKTCSVQVYIGISWLKSCKNQKKITQDIESNASSRLKKIFSELEKESTTTS
jgi:hypothetical protein